jgi:PAS domain S-box-containing protein
MKLYRKDGYLIPQDIRERAINSVFFSSIFIFFPALIISISRNEFTGWLFAYTLQIVVYLGVILLYIFRSKIKLDVKVYILMIFMFSVANTGLYSLGYMGSGKLFFLLIPIFFWFFTRRRIAIVATTISSLTFIFYGYLHVHGYLQAVVDPYAYSMRGASWLTYGMVMLSIVVYCIVLFSKLLEAQQEAYHTTLASEEKYRFITDNIRDVIWIYDITASSIVYVSPSIQNMRGFSVEEYLGQDFSKFMPKQSIETASAQLKLILSEFGEANSPTYYNLELEVYHKNGQTLWIEINTQPRKNPNSGNIELIGTSRDITESKATRIALEKSQERYRLASSASNLGIWDWYTTEKDVYYSDMWKKQIGYESHELKGAFETWVEHLHPDDRDEKVNKVQEYMANPQGQFILEFRFRHKNGTYIWILSRAETTKNDKGEVVRFYGTHQDITELKRKEAELIEQNQMLEKINSELDNFVYRISHDIRAPLSSCFGILNIMESEKLVDEKNEPYIKMIREVLSRQDDVISSILNYSRNSRGELRVESIGLKEMIETTYSDLRFMNDSSGKVALHLNFDENLTFQNDRNRVQFIFNNLLSNAIKYANLDQENPQIEIEIHRENSHLYISVTDNGIGIREDLLPQIFNMFFRGNTSSTGSGLGLYIVKETIKKLGGSIMVESELNKFTSFKIILPEMK